MLGLLTTALIVGLGYVMGLAVLRVGRCQVRSQHLTALALAPGLGLGLVSLAFFFLLQLDLDRRALGWFLGLVFVASAAAAAKTSGERGRQGGNPRPAASGRVRIVSGLLLGVSLYVLSIHAWEIRQTKPSGGFDAVSIWNARAALLYRSDSDSRERYRLFSTAKRGHPQYPLFLPGAIAGQYVLCGEEARSVPLATATAFLLGLTLLVYQGVGRLGQPRLALPAVLVLSSTPAIPNYAFSQFADLPTAYLVLAVVLGLSSHLEGGDDAWFPPLLTGGLVGLLAWTKNEGTVLAALLVGSFVVLAWVSGSRRLVPDGLRVALGSLPGLLALGLFKFSWLAAGEPKSFLADIPIKLTDPGRVSEILTRLLCRLEPWCRGDRWGIVGLFLLVGALLGLGHRAVSWRRRYVGVAFWLGMGSLLAAYLLSPYPLTWHIEQSIDRVLMQIFPLAVVWVFASLPPGPAASTSDHSTWTSFQRLPMAFWRTRGNVAKASPEDAPDATIAAVPKRLLLAGFAVLVVGVVVGVVAIGLLRTSSPPRPSVILISVDTLRPDHLGCYGYDRPTSPEIDRFRRDAVLFRQALAHAPSTLPSHASMLTALLPQQHGVSFSRKTALPDRVTTLAETLRAAGYQTAAIHGGGQLDVRFGLSQGFEVYQRGDPHDFSDQVTRAVSWLVGRGEKPFFLFLHTYETHHPYSPSQEALGHFPEDYSGPLPDSIEVSLLKAANGLLPNEPKAELGDSDLAHIVRSYDAEIRSMDEDFGALVWWLKDSGQYDQTLIVLTSDHGEEFDEHGLIGWHSHSLYDELLRVPLIIKLPGSRRAGQTVEPQARLIDLAPTIVAALGLPTPGEFRGTDLLGSPDSGAATPLPLVSWLDTKKGTSMSLRIRGWKYATRISGRTQPGEHLYDLRSDPGETRNLAPERPGLAAALRTHLEELVEAGSTTEPESVAIDEELGARLRALGYL